MKAMRYLKKVDIGFDFFAERSAGARCVPVLTQSFSALRRRGRARARCHSRLIPACLHPTLMNRNPRTRRRFVSDRLLSQRAIAINPAVVVNIDVHNRRTLPEVKVEYIDGQKQEFGDGTTGVEIIKQIEETADKMMLDKLLQRCAAAPPTPPLCFARAFCSTPSLRGRESSQHQSAAHSSGRPRCWHTIERRSWREEEVVTEMDTQMIKSIIYGVGRRHKPKQSDRESLLAVFAPDLAGARDREIAKRREASSKRQEELAGAGVEHY